MTDDLDALAARVDALASRLEESEPPEPTPEPQAPTLQDEIRARLAGSTVTEAPRPVAHPFPGRSVPAAASDFGTRRIAPPPEPGAVDFGGGNRGTSARPEPTEDPFDTVREMRGYPKRGA